MYETNRYPGREGIKRVNSNHRQKEKGSALVIAILISVMMLLLVMPFLTKLSGQYRVTEKSFRQLAALNLAEAGIERAIWELNHGNITAWEGDDNLRTMVLSSIQTSGGSEVGDIVIEAIGLGGDNPIIQSTGRVPHIGSTNIEKQIYVVLEESGEDSVFNYGIFGDEGFDLNSNAKIDSYDSRDGLYGGDNVSWNGDTGTNATHIGGIYISSNGKIYGDALSGPGSDPETAIITRSNAEIFGEKLALPSEKDLPIIPSPVGLDFKGGYILGSNNQATISESGEYSSFQLNSNAQVTIQGNITMFVAGEFSMNSNTQLIIDEGSSLTLYLGGTFEQNSNTEINNLSKDPTKVQVYGTDSFESEMEWESNSDFYGAVYVPEADVEFESNADFYGSVICKYLHMDSNGKVHYNLALLDIETAVSEESSSFAVKSWQEKIVN